MRLFYLLKTSKFRGEVLLKSLIFLFLLVCGCSSLSSKTRQASQAPLRVLFIGNSLTFMPEFNHPTVPAYVGSLLASKNISVQIDTVLASGRTLENHWKEGKLQTALNEKTYDVVFIQPYSIEALTLPACFAQHGPPGYQPKEPLGPHDKGGPAGREHFLTYAKKIIELVRSKGATPVVVEPWIYDVAHPWLQADFDCRYFPGTKQTWYGDSQEEFQRREDEGYGLLQKQTGVELLRIGPLWQEIRRMNDKALPMSAMYQPDHYHPTYVGALFSALLIAERLTRIPADQFSFRPEQVAPEQEKSLQKVADEYLRPAN